MLFPTSFSNKIDHKKNEQTKLKEYALPFVSVYSVFPVAVYKDIKH